MDFGIKNISLQAFNREAHTLKETGNNISPLFFKVKFFCQTSQTSQTSPTSQTKTKTTTSLAVMKRTARQGEHWNNEERGRRKVPGAPQGGSCLKRQRRQLFGESQKKAKLMSYTIFDNLALSDLHFEQDHRDSFLRILTMLFPEKISSTQSTA